MGARRAGHRRRRRYAGRRLARQARQHPAPVDRPRHRSDPPRRLQCRRPHRRPGRQGPRRKPDPRPLSRRFIAGRPGTAPCARNISSRRRPFRTFYAAICSISAISAPCPTRHAIQLNDTHPAVSVAEMMRLLIDVHNLSFDEAWDITQRTNQLHQPHPAARSAGIVAAAAVRAPAGRATCNWSTLSMPAC